MRIGIAVIALGLLSLGVWVMDPFESWLFSTIAVALVAGGFGFIALSRYRRRKAELANPDLQEDT
jgi:hypothetical protein